MKRILVLTASFFLLSSGSSALGQVSLPPEPESGADAATESEQTQNSILPKSVIDDHKVVEGPLSNERQALYQQIQSAKANGIGIQSYMMAFNYIEEMAGKGATEEDLKKRMVPLISALAGQLKTKEYLKTKPAQSNSASGLQDGSGILSPGQNIPDQLRMFGGMGGAQTDDLIRRAMQEKGGGNIPQGIDKNFIKEKLKDPNIQEKLKDPRVRELLKKYQGGGN